MRAGMRGLAGMVVAAAAMLARVPTASAGTYDVVSCGAPGAGGVNACVAAWSSAASPARRQHRRIPSSY